MAITASDLIDRGSYQLIPQQVEITNRIFNIVQSLALGVENARVNPSAAIPPADQPFYVRDVGIGSKIDFSA